MRNPFASDFELKKKNKKNILDFAIGCYRNWIDDEIGDKSVESNVGLLRRNREEWQLDGSGAILFVFFWFFF